MSENRINELSHKQFVVLGLVAEYPSHAYDINQRIEGRGMRNWTAIGKSSIYRIIGELEEAKYLESYEEEFNKRVRKIYTITPDGIDLLKKKVYSVVCNFLGRNDEDFYVAFSMLPLLSKQQQVKAISNSINNMRNHILELETMLQEMNHLPINVTGLFIHPIKILETDVEFLQWVLKKIQD